jgi:hypothetical protein
VPQPQRKRGGQEFFYVDADGRKRDAELHNAILDEGDHEAAKRVSDKIRARILGKRDAERQKDWDESKHPRVPAGSPEGGQFGEGGDGEGEKEGGAGPVKLDPKVIEVGGDEWNRSVARKLEREYQEARPKIEKLALEGPGKTRAATEAAEEAETQDIEEGEPPYVPESWDMISNSGQSDAEQKYISSNINSYYDSEVENWASESAPDDARNKVTDDFNDGSETDWVGEAIDELRDEGDFPYSTSDLIDAIAIKYNSGYYDWKKNVTIEFDDAQLQNPIDRPPPPDPAQLTMPGIEPPPPQDYSKHLTEDMRAVITQSIIDAMDKEADRVVDKMEPPEYLKESAEEYAGESWAQMDDADKFAWTQSNTNIVEDESIAGTGMYADKEPEPKKEENPLDALPVKYDPLNETTGRDYKRTQALAKYLSVNRATEIMIEREMAPRPGDAVRLPDIPGTTKGSEEWEKTLERRIANVDNMLWRGWVGSSTAQSGILLQVATAEELGGRLNLKTATGINPVAARNWADEHFADIGGYAGIKAYIRAKWETTQYLLDKAHTPELDLYRGINLKTHDPERYAQAVREKGEKQLVTVGGGATSGALNYEKAPTIKVDRNGAASATTDPKIANGWSSDDGRIVLRAVVPRTAVISVPAYGINEYSEHEVVVAGTAWKAWDAWVGKAPLLDMVPIGDNGTGIGANAPLLKAA